VVIGSVEVELVDVVGSVVSVVSVVGSVDVELHGRKVLNSTSEQAQI